MAKRGLGKGLGVLIPTEGASSPGMGRPPASTPEHKPSDAVESAPSRTPSRAPSQSASSAGDRSVVDQGAVYAEIPIDSLHANPRQPRTVFDE